MTDYLICNAKVFTGHKDEQATVKNVYIKKGKVEAIGGDPILVDDSVIKIEASGKWFTPGFIDTHTQLRC